MRYIKKITQRIGDFDTENNFIGTETIKIIEYQGYQRGKSWFIQNGWYEYSGVLPVSRLDIVEDTVIELPAPEPTEFWIDTETFINILYVLLSGETISNTINNPDTLKDAIAGLALLSSNAAPGMVDVFDDRVVSWLSLVNLTVEQVIDVLKNNGGM